LPAADPRPPAGDPGEDAAPPTEPTLRISLAAPPLSVSVAVNGEIVQIRPERDERTHESLPPRKAWGCYALWPCSVEQNAV
jgi:hypothetical protein